MDNIKTILEFLGEENQQKIRDAMTEGIIENICDSIRDQWFMPPSIFEDVMKECFHEVFEKHKKEFVEAMDAKIVMEFMKNCKES